MQNGNHEEHEEKKDAGYYGLRVATFWNLARLGAT